jgi:hypothetical protein
MHDFKFIKNTNQSLSIIFSSVEIILSIMFRQAGTVLQFPVGFLLYFPVGWVQFTVEVPTGSLSTSLRLLYMLIM